MKVAYPEHEQWVEHVGETFTICPVGLDPIPVELIAATPRAPGAGRPDGARAQPFSLVFRHAKAKTFVNQGTHQVDHDELGSFPIFLVPVGPDDHGMRYEAVFN